MAKSNKEHTWASYKQIAQQIEHLYNTGLTHGCELTEDQIDSCIITAMNTDVRDREPESNPNKHVSIGLGLASAISKVRYILLCCIKYTVCCAGLIIGLILSVYTLTIWYPPCDKLVNQLALPYSYHVYRIVRFTTLPLARSFNLVSLYGLECLVPNPMFMEPPLDCVMCHRLVRPKSVNRKKLKRFMEDFISTATPVIFKDVMDNKVTYNNLKDLYFQKESKLQEGLTLLDVSEEQILSVSDIFSTLSEQDIKNNRIFHAVWVGWKVESSRIIRTLFPRPYFIPKVAEVSFQVILYIDGPRAKPYTLLPGAFANMWYVQGSGKRTLVLIPKKECLMECKPLHITMNPREILYFSDIYWRVDSIPVPGTQASEEPNIAYVGAFS